MATKRFHQAEALVPATAAVLFEYLDDPRRLGAHMEQSSWRLAGTRMDYVLDAAQGRGLGAKIGMRGRMLGLRLSLDEVVTRYQPPLRKTWQTVAQPRLFVIGQYEMGIEIEPRADACRLRVFISYSLPAGPAWLLGWLLGGFYARWCVRRMAADAAQHFASSSPP